MSTAQIKRRCIIGFLLCVSAVYLIGRFTDFYPRWRKLRDGMSQAQVTEFLGKPTWTGSSGAKGAGDKDVIRWEYKRGRWTYCVDFDYIEVLRAVP